MTLERLLPSRTTAYRLIILLFLAHGLHQIYAFSHVHEGERYFLLADDQFVSMAYAKNLVNGNGLVWYKGAPKVEGFTNPAWVLIMAAVQLLPLAASKTALAVQLLCLALLAANLHLVKGLSERFLGKESPWPLACVLLTAFYYPLTFWSLSGFEVALLAPLIALAVKWELDEEETGTPSARSLYLLAAATTVRLDMAVAFLALAAVKLLLHRKSAARALAKGIAALAGALLLQTLVRYLYYGEVLPNTYYLKMEGYPSDLRIARGFLVYLDFLLRAGLLPALSLLALLLPQRRKAAALLAPFAAMSAYSIYVGGDSWEYYGLCNRFVVTTMPLALVALVALAAHLSKNAWNGGGNERLGVKMTVTVATLLLVLNNTGRFEDYERVALGGAPERENVARQFEAAKLAEKITAEDATIAVVWAGMAPYFTERRFLDLLGKNDKTVAREPMHLYNPEKPTRFKLNNPRLSAAGFFYPGHLKWNNRYSLAQRKPDVICSIWAADKAAKESLENDYFMLRTSVTTVMVRRDSEKVDTSTSGDATQTRWKINLSN